jgi:hypothetical protein
VFAIDLLYKPRFECARLPCPRYILPRQPADHGVRS